MNYTDAFAAYGATLRNVQWSVSAFSKDGRLVVCLWENYLKPGRERATMEYNDMLSTWLGNAHGRNEFSEHLRIAKSRNLDVLLVIAHPVSPSDKEQVGRVGDESTINKTFSVKENVIGTLEEYDGNALRIVFRRAA